MQMSVTRDEYDAVKFAISQLQGAIEGCEQDSEFIGMAARAEDDLLNFAAKYEKASSKRELLQALKREIRKQKPGLSERFVLKAARSMMRSVDD